MLASRSSQRQSRSAQRYLWGGDFRGPSDRQKPPSSPYAGWSQPCFQYPKAIGNKPGTGNKRGVRLGWGQGLEVQSKILGLNSHPGTRSASSGLGIPLQLLRVSVSAEPGL